MNPGVSGFEFVTIQMNDLSPLCNAINQEQNYARKPLSVQPQESHFMTSTSINPRRSDWLQLPKVVYTTSASFGGDVKPSVLRFWHLVATPEPLYMVVLALRKIKIVAHVTGNLIGGEKVEL